MSIHVYLIVRLMDLPCSLSTTAFFNLIISSFSENMCLLFRVLNRENRGLSWRSFPTGARPGRVTCHFCLNAIGWKSNTKPHLPARGYWEIPASFEPRKKKEVYMNIWMISTTRIFTQIQRKHKIWPQISTWGGWWRGVRKDFLEEINGYWVLLKNKFGVI